MFYYAECFLFLFYDAAAADANEDETADDSNDDDGSGNDAGGLSGCQLIFVAGPAVGQQTWR